MYQYSSPPLPNPMPSQSPRTTRSPLRPSVGGPALTVLAPPLAPLQAHCGAGAPPLGYKM